MNRAFSLKASDNKLIIKIYSSQINLERLNSGVVNALVSHGIGRWFESQSLGCRNRYLAHSEAVEGPGVMMTTTQ